MLRYPFIWLPFAASCLNLGSSCCEEEERRLLGNICRSLITCRTGRRRRRRPRAAVRPRERTFLARARGYACLGDRAEADAPPRDGAAAPAGGPPLMAAAPASPPGPTGSLAACETPEVDRGHQKCSKNLAKRSKHKANSKMQQKTAKSMQNATI